MKSVNFNIGPNSTYLICIAVLLLNRSQTETDFEWKEEAKKVADILGISEANLCKAYECICEDQF